MKFSLKYTIFLYLIILLFLYLSKPELFALDVDDKKRKILYLFFLVIIISIICFYFKVMGEFFF
jgi:hypothetical protein